MFRKERCPIKGNRRTGRELALKIIFGLREETSDCRGLLDQFWANFRFEEDELGEPLDSFTEQVPLGIRCFAEELASGIAEHLRRIDGAISDAAQNWSLERMASVDLAILRLATFELLYRPETPVTAVLNEAIEIGKCFGTKETPAFVNGILDRIAKEHRKKAASGENA